METLIGIAVVVLVGFAIFVLQQDAAEQRRAGL
jgi:preprotein translocase subunit Sss1